MTALKWMDELLARLLVSLIKIYKLTLSPLIGQQCRFYPTCSSYAVTALRVHGGVRGFWLTVRRLVRCHPFAEGGVDDVPPVSCTKEHRHHQQQVGEV